MLDNMIWKEISVYKIRSPEAKYADLCIPCEEFLLDRFRIGDNEKELFSEEAAELLTKVHPIIVWPPKNYCIFGIRTFFIVSSIIPDKTIRVGVLPPKTTDHEIAQFIRVDAWLTRLAFATRSPEANLFQASKKMPKELVRLLTPGLELKVVNFAKTLGVSVPTLYGPGGTKKETVW
jgi:hypothetical protein